MRLAAASQRPQRLTPGLFFFLLLSRVDFKPILFMRHISHLKAAQRDLQTTQTKKKAQLKYKKSRERNADRFKTRRQTNKYISYQRKQTDSSLDLKAAQPGRCAVFQIYTHFFAMIRQMWLSNKQIRNIMEAV